MSAALEKFLLDVRTQPTFESFSKVDHTTRNCVGDTALHIAVIRGNFEIVKELLSVGADHSQKGEHGFTPLHEAVLHDQRKIIPILMESGADPLVKNDWDMDSFELAELDDSEQTAGEIKGMLSASN